MSSLLKGLSLNTRLIFEKLVSHSVGRSLFTSTVIVDASSNSQFICERLITLTPKELERGHFDSPPCGFSKYVSSKEKMKPFFVTFNIIISHIFPENLIEIPQVVQKIWRISLSILPIFFSFLFFNISLLQRN